MWYNRYRKKEVTKMQKVIRVCAITGRKTVVANNLTENDAINLVIKLAKEDNLATFYRIKK
jgi:hypothetical protein